MKGLTDIPGIRVGHATHQEALTGCTAVLIDGGATAGVDIRGSATGTEETPVLDPGHLAPLVHAVVLSGGSAFGLEAVSGVRHFLRDRGVGFLTAHGPVPIVTGAILYDLGIGRSDVFPDRAMGWKAAEAASPEAVAEGNVGAGTGATVGKVRGMRHAMKAGIGTATVALNSRHSGVLVSALAAVNAYGDVVEDSGKVLAGTRVAPASSRLAGSEEALVQDAAPGGGPLGAPATNTTLCVVATNAKLDRVEATQLARAGSLGLARSIRPVFTRFDGDIVFALSKGDRAADPTVLGVAAARAVAQAVVRAVRLAGPAGGLPGLAQR
jgi:L-aminopeptidase/D-esterase-like protein